MEPLSPKLPQKNTFTFSDSDRTITFMSDFDGGNIAKVTKQGHNYYNLWTAADCEGMEVQGYSKSWFYFSVQGFQDCKATFVMNRIQVLWSLLRCPEKYRPVYRVQGSNWKRLPTEIKSLVTNRENEVILTFEFMFPKEESTVEFAFTYPYSYSDLQYDLTLMQEKYQNRAEYYFHRSVLVKSPEGRNVDCLVISSHDGRDGYEGIRDKNILCDQKLARFKANKPLILITARVHPLETPASFVMNGIINFLTNLDDARAYILRKNFTFLLVPMLNPDGVYRGHCRMDIFNQNLNRYYNTPDLGLQPSCYAIRKLVEHYTTDKRLFFYLDLHAHPANKGNFVFGNAIYDYVMQVESTVFPKVLSENCSNFQFQQCNFSRKHMTAKDRFQELNKEGCGRVVMYKDFGIIHAYTLECGYHSNTQERVLPQIRNKNSKFVLKKSKTSNGQMTYDLKPFESKLANSENQETVGCCEQDLDNSESKHYKQPIPFYTIEVHQNLGKNILVSILDIWNKNPYPRVTDPNQFRKEIAMQNRKLDRFRREQTNLKTKQMNIIQLIEEQFYATWRKKNVFSTQKLKTTSISQAKRALTVVKDAQTKTLYQKQRFQSRFKFVASSEKRMNQEESKDNKDIVEAEKEELKINDRDVVVKSLLPQNLQYPQHSQHFDDGTLFTKYTYKFRISKKP